MYGPDKWGALPRRNSLLPREEKALPLALNALQGGKRFLDVGCGDGFFLKQVQDKSNNPELFGLDLSEHQLSKVPEVVEAQLQVADLNEDIPLSDDSMSVIYAGEVIEHLYNPDLFITECHRVLELDGVLVLTTPNLCAWYNRLLFLLGTQPLFLESSTRSTTVGAGFTRPFRQSTMPVGHVHVYNRRAITDLLELHGFRVVTVKSAVFDAFPDTLQRLDSLFTPLPSFGSILVLAATPA